jgi:hypothetical protein
MSKLKNNIDSLTTDTENIAKEYLNLLVIRITERLSLFIGILFSVFIISTLLLIVVLIGSIALAGFLNNVLSTEVWGHLIVAGVYLLVIALLVIKMVRSETPLLSNLFIKLMIFILDINDPQTGSVKGLKVEEKRIKEKLELNKDKLKTDFQLLRYSLLDGLMKELLGLFTRKKKTSSKTASRASSKTTTETPKPKKRTRKKE